MEILIMSAQIVMHPSSMVIPRPPQRDDLDLVACRCGGQSRCTFCHGGGFVTSTVAEVLLLDQRRGERRDSGRRMTTNETVARDLARSLEARLNGTEAGSTFGDFILACRQLGIRDSDPLGSIEYGIAQIGTGRVITDRDEFGAVEIREAR
jgi:hypothetical protein